MPTPARCVAGHWGAPPTKHLTLAALNHALQQATPHIFHSDQGAQYLARQHIQRLATAQIEISMADKGCPTQNAIVERFIRTLKEEHIQYSEYRDFQDAARQLHHWLAVVYMAERPHQALNYATPGEFELASAL